MSIFSFIKERLAIQDVVSEYVALKPAGTYLKARCPFHQERTGSFTVSPDRNIFYCFGCHAGGDVISFIAKAENCSHLEAAKLLSERYRIDLPDDIDTQPDGPSSDAKEQHAHACRFVANWCHEQLLKNASVMQYLHKRGFNQVTIRAFKVGYFPGGIRNIRHLETACRAQNLLPKDLVEAHILFEGKTTLYSPFEERIIFPIHDTLGRTCGFGGRVFKPNDERPKYYNSPEGPLFSKGSLLFGLDLAKKAIQTEGRAFLVEGYTDCIAMVQHGFANTVATLGTACTVKHLQAVTRHACRISIVYDGDAAGTQAIMRLASLCWQAGAELDVVILPPGKDPASLLTEGDDLHARCNKAQDIFSFFVASTGSGMKSLSLREKVAKIRTILDVIATIDDPLKQDLILQQAVQVCEIPLETLRSELNGLRKLTETAPQQGEKKRASCEQLTDTTNPYSLEKRVFCAILSNVSLLNSQNEMCVLEAMPAALGTVLRSVRQITPKGGPVDMARLFEIMDGQEQELVSKLLLAHGQPVLPDEFDRLVAQLRRQQWRIAIQSLKARIARAQQAGDIEQTTALLKEFMKLKQSALTNTQDRNNDTVDSSETQ